MKRKALSLIVLLAICLLAFCACGDGNVTNTTTASETQTTAAIPTTAAVVEPTTTAVEATTTAAEPTTTAVVEPATRKIVDMKGDEVKIPMEVKTVINGWPASNSVMLLIGAGKLLTGTMSATAGNEWSQLIYPEIVNVPVNLSNAEDILKANPDLYIASGGDVIGQLRAAGQPAVSLMFSDYEDMKQSFTILGEILGGEYQTKLANWCKYVDDWKATITERLKDVKEEDKPVLYYNSAQQSAALTASFASPSICKSWANICGCVYLNDLTANPASANLSEEEILKINPDVIIVGGIKQAEAWEALQKSELWADVDAMKNDKAFLAPMGMFSWCRFGMESAMMLPWLASIVYPELFPEINIREIVFDFYKDFAGVELTDAQIENMLIGYGPNDPYGATVVGK